MAIPKIGERARSFRLPSAQGGEVGLDDYQGREAVVLWFTKGMACAFCRQQMSQLARASPRIKEELRPRGRAVRHLEHLASPLEKRSHGLGYYAKTLVTALKIESPPSDFDSVKPALAEFPGLLADEDMGFFIIDRAGVVRYVLAGPYFNEAGPHGIPGADEIVRELERCAAAA
jgi:alkylhydroperoxidase family enzyme